MSLNKTVGLLAGAASITLTGVSFGGGTTPSDTDARIAALENQIAEIKAERESNWLNPDRQEEIRAMIQDVMADSANRTSLLSAAGGAGMGPQGAWIESADGNFSLNIGLMAQLRAVWNQRDRADGGTLDESLFGFENTRTKIDFDGHMFDESIMYRIEGNFSYSGGGFALEDAYVGKQYDNGWSAAMGQFRDPFLYEEMIRPENQLPVERSTVANITNTGITQGILLCYESDEAHFAFSFNDGAAISTMGLNGDTRNTAWAFDGNEYSFTARGDFNLGGDWADFEDFTARDNAAETSTRIGAAINFQDNEYGTTAEEVQSLSWTIDGQMETNTGFNLFASLTGLSTDPNSSSASSVDQLGVVVQGGMYVDENNEWELFGRWEYYDFDSVFGPSSPDEVNLLTVGVTRYVHGNNLKWTTDVVFGLEEMPISDPMAGLLSDDSDQDGQIALRSQITAVLR